MKKIEKIYYYSGTHWDREWYRTFQSFRYDLVKVTDEILEVLENDSGFSSFTFDGQTIVLEDYCQVRPENRKRLADLLASGRIHAGPWYVMPDEFLCSGESLIRNLQTGHRTAREFGAPDAMKYGFVCDVFGHIAQLPQILSGFGIKGALLGRGTNTGDTPAHFLWVSPDGSSCITFKVPEECGYGTFWLDVWEPYDSGKDTSWENVISRACRYIETELERSPIPYVVLMDSMDHTRIQRLAPKLAAELAEIFGCPVVFESLDNLSDDIARNHKDLLKVQKGELLSTAERLVEHNALISFTMSSRYDIKLQNDNCQTLFEKWAVPMQLISEISQSKNPNEKIPRAYLDIAGRLLITNHAHDSICGCSIDEVHQDMHARFRQAKAISEEIVFDAATKGILPEYSEPSAAGSADMYLEIWNMLPFSRSGEWTADILFDRSYPNRYWEQCPAEKINSFKLLGPDGSEIPYTLLKIRNDHYVRVHQSSYRKQKDVYTISFHAELPPMGKLTLSVIPSETPSRYFKKIHSSFNKAENPYILLEIQSDGTVNMTDKETGRIYRDLISFLDDGEIGDGWYHVSPVNDSIVSSTGFPSSIERISDGAAGTVFRITKSMRVRNSEILITSDIRLGASAKYIDVSTQIQNTASDHRMRLVIPTGCPEPAYHADQAFCFIERRTGRDPATASWKESEKREKTFDSMFWKRSADGTGLLFTSGGGMHEVAALEDENGTMLVTLFRSFSRTFLTNGEKDGQLQGELYFKYRITPVDPQMTFADMLRSRDDFRSGVFCYSYLKEYRNEGEYDPGCNSRTPLFAAENGNIVISIMKSPDSDEPNEAVVRLFNASDKETDEVFHCSPIFREYAETDFLEQPKDQFKPVSDGRIDMHLRPFEIKTLLFRL